MALVLLLLSLLHWLLLPPSSSSSSSATFRYYCSIFIRFLVRESCSLSIRNFLNAIWLWPSIIIIIRSCIRSAWSLVSELAAIWELFCSWRLSSPSVVLRDIGSVCAQCSKSFAFRYIFAFKRSIQGELNGIHNETQKNKRNTSGLLCDDVMRSGHFLTQNNNFLMRDTNERSFQNWLIEASFVRNKMNGILAINWLHGSRRGEKKKRRCLERHNVGIFTVLHFHIHQNANAYFLPRSNAPRHGKTNSFHFIWRRF